MGPIGCLETSVNNYKSMLGNILEKRRSSLKSKTCCKKDENFFSVADVQTENRTQQTLRTGCKWLRVPSNTAEECEQGHRECFEKLPKVKN